MIDQTLQIKTNDGKREGGGGTGGDDDDYRVERRMNTNTTTTTTTAASADGSAGIHGRNRKGRRRDRQGRSRVVFRIARHGIRNLSEDRGGAVIAEVGAGAYWRRLEHVAERSTGTGGPPSSSSLSSRCYVDVPLQPSRLVPVYSAGGRRRLAPDLNLLN